MPIALKVALEEPILVAGALIAVVVLVLTPISPEMRQYDLQVFLAQLGYQLFATALSCKAIWVQEALMNDDDEPVAIHWLPVLKAYVNSVLYNIISTIGMIFFIIPGVVFATRGILSLPVICLEDRGIISSFLRSVDLTAERFKGTLIYMIGPTLCLYTSEVLITNVMRYIAPGAYRDITASLDWAVRHPFVATTLICSGVLTLLIQVSAMPLFTKVYVEYAGIGLAEPVEEDDDLIE
jgi:hypothetical protein